MNCLQYLPRSSVLPVQSFKSYASRPSCHVHIVGVMNTTDLRRSFVLKAISGSTSSTEMNDAELKEEKSKTYSTNMTEAMGAAVVSKLHKAINRNGGITYVHCTAGLGRAPAAASKHPCFPKLDAIKSATADILAGLKKKLVTLTWKDGNYSTVEISGLDIGWDPRMPSQFDKEQGLWILKRELPVGRYEYKYIMNGEWMCNRHELVTSPNKDGHVNNYVQVLEDDPNSINAVMRERVMGDDPNLTKDERLKIRQFLEGCL